MQQSLTMVQLSSDWEDKAINHFFHNYILMPSAERRGYLEFLPGLYATNPDNLGLRHALLAISMASFANVANLRTVRTAAYRHYGHALRSARKTLEDPESASSDCSLASIILLQKYEVSLSQ